MNQLLKYILIVNIYFILFFSLGSLTFYYLDYYDKTNVPAPTYDSRGQMPSIAPSSNIRTPLIHYIFFPLAIIQTLLIIFLSARYVFLNPETREYLKSFTVPFSFIIISLILLLLLMPCSGEECMGKGLVVIFYYPGLLVASLIINTIILFAKRQ